MRIRMDLDIFEGAQDWEELVKKKLEKLGLRRIKK